MSAAQALSVARAAGIHLEVDGDDLLLEASSPPPADVLDLLTRHKADVLRMLRPAEDGWSAEDWQALYGERAGHFEFDCGLSRTSAEERAFEACIIDWLNRNPARSPAGRCGAVTLRPEMQLFCLTGPSPGPTLGYMPNAGQFGMSFVDLMLSRL
jgi:hypothetical protein